MRAFTRMLALLICFAVPSVVFAQEPLNPSGHYEGAAHAPGMEIVFQIDVVQNGKSELSGTFAQPEQNIKGLPLSFIALDGRTLRFAVRGSDGTSSFAGDFAEDGMSISGNVALGEHEVPFDLKWTGVARVAEVPKSKAIGKDLEGTWNGTLNVQGQNERIVLKLWNNGDGTASGTVMSPDGSGLEIAVAIKQDGANVTVDIPSVGVSYTATFDAAAGKLTGTWSQATVSAPLTFERSEIASLW